MQNSNFTIEFLVKLPIGTYVCGDIHTDFGNVDKCNYLEICCTRILWENCMRETVNCRNYAAVFCTRICNTSGIFFVPLEI